MLATPMMALLLMATPWQAQQSTKATTEDQTFVNKVAKDGQAEVELATLAQKKASHRQSSGPGHADSNRSRACECRADGDRAPQGDLR